MKKKWLTGFPEWECLEKLRRIMRITLFLVVGLVLAVSANSYSQTKRLDINLKNSTLREIMAYVEDHSEFVFLYKNEDLNMTRKVDVQLTDAPIELILKQILQGEKVVYDVYERQIVIRKGEANQSIQQQKKSIKGKVFDSTGGSLPGVSVVVKGTTNGGITDMDGVYSLSNIPENATLQFSFVGMKTQEIAVGGKTSIDVTLLDDAIGIEEVVAVGYGIQKKVNLTGSVGSIGGEELERRPVVNVTQSLQGIVPGLNVSVSSKTKPGQSFDLNIRGQGNLSGSDKPYVLVDGIEMSLSDVNPNDVESISVLKDAAASAIYGARAPYGVILVTTKKGEDGKMSVSYSSNVGISSPIKLPNMANSADFARFFNSATFNALGTKQYSEDKIALLEQYIRDPKGMSVFPEVNNNIYSGWENSANGVANTNWFKLHYKPYAVKQEHNINVSGGNKATQFYISGGYYNEGGSLRFADIDYNRYNLNANITSTLTSWIKVKANTKYTKSKYNSPFSGGFENMFFHNLARMRPNVSPYDLNGNWSEQSNVPYLESGSQFTEDKNVLILLTGLELEPIKNWKIFTNLNFRQTVSEQSTLLVPGVIYGIDGTPMSATRSEYGIPAKGSYARTMGNENYTSPEIFSSYALTIKENHNLSVLVGFQQDLDTYKELTSSAQDLINPNRPGISMVTGLSNTSESRWDCATRGFFGRFNYDYKGKYLFEANGRYDGSSRFKSDTRWGFFPSFSLGYNIAKEGFMADYTNLVSQLKVRASYGFLGNQAGAGMYSYSESMNMMIPGLPGSGSTWYFDKGREPYIVAPASFNQLISWEKIENLNFGLDFSVLKNSLSGSLDLYQRNTRDMLGPTLDIADMYGSTPPLSNNADMRNRGWELSLNYRGSIRNIKYTIGGVLSDYNSVVTKYQNPTNSDPANVKTWYEGKNVGEIWGYRASGLIQTADEAIEYNKIDHSYLTSVAWKPGDVKYLDLNGDKKLNIGSNKLGDMGDLTIIGNNLPRFAYSLNGSVSWKGLSLYMLFQGIGKRDFAPAMLDAYFWGSGALAQVTVFKEHLDYWSETNPNAYYPNPYASPAGSISTFAAKSQQVSDRYLQNASYLRLKNVTLNYTIPEKITHALKLKSTDIFFSGENIFTITKLAKMFDPETLSGSGGLGKIYPLSKVFSIGLKVKM